MKTKRFGAYWLLITLIILIAFWFIPISGSVIIDGGASNHSVWPKFDIKNQSSALGSIVDISVLDNNPWSYVELVVDGKSATPQGDPVKSGTVWTWRWSYPVPSDSSYKIIFYRNCHTGCEERGRMTVGLPAETIHAQFIPTKLGVVMPNTERDWHRRSGWAVEITYAARPEDPYWGVDDLAARIADHQLKGLRVLVRVDYDQNQSIPPKDNYVLLAEYLAYFSRLARDERLAPVYGYIVGNDYNTNDATVLNPEQPITPDWYARVFNGYGENPYHQDNVVQTIKGENPDVRVIVGPIRPWTFDVDGDIQHPSGMPWLNYMNSVVAYIDEASRIKNGIGIPLNGPDGFDIQAPGRPDAVEMADLARYEEPAIDLYRESWNNTQAGFRVYQDWLDVINSYATTRGLPVYIISTNTYDREANIPPAQNYPKGWLATALAVINAEPQIHALCWFLDDFPHSDQWNWFSLTRQSGRLVDAAEEFDSLLQLP